MTYAKSSWTALAEPSRRTIFDRLVAHPSSETELAATLPLSRQAVSQHLKVLKEAGRVADAPAGKHRIYRVDPAGLAALRAELDLFWSTTLAAYKVAVEQPTEE